MEHEGFFNMYVAATVEYFKFITCNNHYSMGRGWSKWLKRGLVQILKNH